ncbi:hypothetical protein TNCV_3044611, partial [Trichonephila clavipes]
MTLLGTIRKNKPELPEEMPYKEAHISTFYFTEDTAVVNYIPKKNKNVILISTLHYGKEVSNVHDKKTINNVARPLIKGGGEENGKKKKDQGHGGRNKENINNRAERESYSEDDKRDGDRKWRKSEWTMISRRSMRVVLINQMHI